MKITHNSNNDWKDEAKMIGLDEDLYLWIEAIIADVENYGESLGIVKILKWVLCITSYKSKDDVNQLINEAIEDECKKYPKLKLEQRY